MHGKVTDEEWEIFRQAYLFYADHCDPPATQETSSEAWWRKAATDVAKVDHQWEKVNSLMRELLIGIYNYMGDKAKTRTEEYSDFVPEQMEEKN